MDCQAARRDSSGWVDVVGSWEVDVDEEEEVVDGTGVREERSVSWTPGADGAPLEVEEEEVLVVEVVCWVGGAIRRDW